MKLLADENIDGPVIVMLRAMGHDVLSIAENAPGVTDPQVLMQAAAQDRILITYDRDFGELIFHGRGKAYGIILLRLAPAGPNELLNRVRQVWPELERTANGHFIVVTMTRIRVRPMPPYK